jgi:hypothetical protein
MLQQTSFIFHDPVACYMEDLVSSSLQPLIYDVFEDGDVDFQKQS